MKKKDYAAQQIKEWIKSGKLPPGAKLPTILNLAKTLGMTDQPIRKALSQLTDEGLIYSRNRAGIFVCGPDTEKRKILILTNYAENATENYKTDFTVWQMYKGITEILFKKKYDHEVCLLENFKTTPNAISKKFSKEKCRGIILLDIEAENVAEHIARNIGYENIVSAVYNEPSIRYNSIRIDFYEALTSILQKAYSLGHRNFSFLYGKNIAEHWSHMERYRTFNEFCLNNSLKIDPELMISIGGTALDGYKATMEILNKGKEVSLIFAATDDRAKGVLEALKDKGITPGKEISVIGFDNMPGISEWNLATVAIPRHEIGIAAVEMLDHTVKTKQTRMVKKITAYPVYEQSLGPAPK